MVLGHPLGDVCRQLHQPGDLSRAAKIQRRTPRNPERPPISITNSDLQFLGLVSEVSRSGQ
jgi:hypothetical protein